MQLRLQQLSSSIGTLSPSEMQEYISPILIPASFQNWKLFLWQQ